jgi:hypothetical protein
MNQKLRELARVSGFIVDETGTFHEFAEKTRLDCFSDLIIKQCVQSLWTEECHTSDLAHEEFTRNSRKIKEHFGLK